MKIIQSFLTKTMSDDRIHENLILAALSLSYAHENGYEVKMYTDSFGYELLKDFGYEEINTELDNIIDIEYIDKIINYVKYFALSKEPIGTFHIDYDVFLQNPNVLDNLNGDIIVQSVQHITPIQYKYQIDIYGLYKDDEILKDIDRSMFYNCGVVCFNNQSLFNTFYSKLTQFIENHKSSVIPKNICEFIEGSLLYILTKSYNVSMLYNDLIELPLTIQAIQIKKHFKEIGLCHLSGSDKYSNDCKLKCVMILMNKNPELFDLINKLIFDKQHIRKIKKTGRVAICSIIKDEHMYIEEWILHHLNLGFTDIYLYEDLNSLSHEQITKKYPEVHLRNIEDIPYDYYVYQEDGCIRQDALYKFFIEDIYRRHHIDWCAFIDVDEYINFDEGYTLRSFIKEYSEFKGVYLKWMFMNANGHMYRCYDGIVKNYTQSIIPDNIDEYFPFKSFVNFTINHKEDWLGAPHGVNNLVNINKEESIDSSLMSTNVCHIKHYITKSFEDYMFRLHMRGDSFFRKCRFMENWDALNPDLKDKEYLYNDIQKQTYNLIKNNKYLKEGVIYNDNHDTIYVKKQL